MRTLTTQETAVLAAPDGYSVHTRVWVWSGSAWVDVTNLEGRDWLVSVKYDESIDQPCAKATVRLRRRIDRLSLNPLVSNKLTGTLALGRAFYVETATVPLGDPPQASDWREVFRGEVEELDLTGDPLTFGGRDMGGPLIRAFNKVERKYGNNTSGVPLETVLQSFLTDTGTGVTLSAPATGVMLGELTVPAGPVLLAARALAQRVGWDVRYRWAPATSNFRLTLYLPQRTATAPVWTWQPYAYENVNEAKQDVHDVRNEVSVQFLNKNKPDAEGNPTLDEVVREDAASIAKYRRSFMRLTEGSDSPIRTQAEAENLAGYALADLKEPLLLLSVACEYLYAAELGDMHRFVANGEHFSSDQTLAVVGLSHELTSKGARTTVQTRGQPAGAHADWLRRETRVVRGPVASPPAAPTGVVATPVPGGGAVSFTSSTGFPAADSYELHLSTTSGFTPSSATYAGWGYATRFERTDLAPGTTFYARVLARGGQGQLSTPSAEVSFTAGYVEADHIADGAVGSGQLQDGAIATRHLMQPPSENMVPNGYGEAEASAVGQSPEGNGLVYEPANAFDPNKGWCRKGTLTALYNSLEFTGYIPCKPGDEFYAEAQAKVSASFGSHAGRLVVSFLAGDYGSLDVASFDIDEANTVYSTHKLKVVAPPDAAFLVLGWQTDPGWGTTSVDIGKSVFFDCIQLRRMVTFDLVSANTFRTSNYAEDASGIPTAGAKMDNVGTALKVAPDNVQVGRYTLSDGFFRAMDAISSDVTGTKRWYKGSNLSPTPSNPSPVVVPDIARVGIQVADQYVNSTQSWVVHHVCVRPNAPGNNLDGLRFLEVQYWVGTPSSANPRGIRYFAIPDRKYGNLSADDHADNEAWGSLFFEWPTFFSGTTASSPYVYLLVGLHGVRGRSAQRWFLPPAGFNTFMSSQTASPFTGGSSGGGSSGGGGGEATCPAPDEPILLASGQEIPAEAVQVGDMVLTQHEHSLQMGMYRVTAVSRNEDAWRWRLGLKDGRAIGAERRHRFFRDGAGWTPLYKLRPGDRLVGPQPGVVRAATPLDRGPVIMMTIEEAHTYVNRGLLSHNMKLDPLDP